MTDDASTPTGDDRPASSGTTPGTTTTPGTAPATGSSAGRAADGSPEAAAKQRRRRLILIAVAVVAVVVLLVCGGLGALIAGVGRLTDDVDDRREAHGRAEAACLELERRLNRLAPPASTGDPGRRAAAIRDENAAVRPFLSEIEQLGGGWRGDGRWRGDDDSDDDSGGGRPGFVDAWREMVDARTSYADALDRQVTNGEPAFFIAPQDQRGRPLSDRLERGGPQDCAGAARRLAAPDL